MRGEWPIVIPAQIVNGELRVSASRLAAALDGRRNGMVTVTIDRLRAARSVQANNYYWRVLGLISDHTGDHDEALHEMFKRDFLGREVVLVNKHGEIIHEGRVGRTTTTLGAGEFYDYVERVRQVAAELGVVTPDPDPHWREAQREGVEA